MIESGMRWRNYEWLIPGLGPRERKRKSRSSDDKTSVGGLILVKRLSKHVREVCPAGPGRAHLASGAHQPYRRHHSTSLLTQPPTRPNAITFCHCWRRRFHYEVFRRHTPRRQLASSRTTWYSPHWPADDWPTATVVQHHGRTQDLPFWWDRAGSRLSTVNVHIFIHYNVR